MPIGRKVWDRLSSAVDFSIARQEFFDRWTEIVEDADLQLKNDWSLLPHRCRLRALISFDESIRATQAVLFWARQGVSLRATNSNGHPQFDLGSAEPLCAPDKPTRGFGGGKAQLGRGQVGGRRGGGRGRGRGGPGGRGGGGGGNWS